MRITVHTNHAATAMKVNPAAWLASLGHEVIGPRTDASADCRNNGYRLTACTAVLCAAALAAMAAQPLISGLQ